MIGIDVVDVARFRTMVEGTPAMLRRFFTEDERAYCETFADPIVHLAGTFAAKEAVMKTLGLTPAPAWARRIEVTRTKDGAPTARVEGRDVAISISHDGGTAVAVALAPRFPA